MFKACLNYREPVDGQHGQLSKILSQNENNVKSLGYNLVVTSYLACIRDWV